jgi:hypothetical protein
MVLDRPFSLADSAAIHRKAVGAERASAFLGSRNLMYDTAVGEESEGFIITDLLELSLR